MSVDEPSSTENQERRSAGARHPEQRTHQAEHPLTQELETMLWVQQEIRSGRPLALAEADAVAGSLFLRMRESADGVVPLLRDPDTSIFLGIHAINVALLSVALAEDVHFDEPAVRKVALAALLHDIGMARVPLHILTKPGQISPDEREAIKQHPREGARIILAARETLDLPAVVAYEHHMKADGSGYPKISYPRAPHYVSRLVQLCDIYHALRSPRPFRQPWPPEIVASFLSERAGFEFHPGLANALTALMPRLEGETASA